MSSPAIPAVRPTTPGFRTALSPSVAFAGFGVFWGAWGAALPALRTQAGVSEGQLGTALLFVGLGALPAMALTGRAVDRFGLRVAAWLLAALAGAGLLIAAGAHGVTTLMAGMLVVGGASGAADVAINALAGRAEHLSDKPLLTRAAGLFSVGVVVASLSTGALLGAGLSLLLVFAGVAAVMSTLAGITALTSTALRVPATESAVDAGPRAAVAPAVTTPSVARRFSDMLRRTAAASTLLVVGLVAALAYAVENAHQSWGAVMLTDIFGTSPQWAAVAPATFAATAAVVRLTLAPLSRSHPTALLVGGGAIATAGSVVLATAPTLHVALVGLILAALGTAPLFPTLLSRSLRSVDPAQQGRATSSVAATAYLGFLLGPAYVGLLAESAGLRSAMLGVGALALLFTVVAAPASTRATRDGHGESRSRRCAIGP